MSALADLLPLATDAVVTAIGTSAPRPADLYDAAPGLALETIEASGHGAVVLHLIDSCGTHFPVGYWPAVHLGTDGQLTPVAIESERGVRARRAYDGGMQRRATPAPVVWAFVPYILTSLVHVILLTVDSPAAGPTKLLLMPLLAAPVILAAPILVPRGSLVLLLGAILFSWLGDGAGTLFPTAPELPLMLTFFGMAHLAYITLFLRHLASGRMPWWALLYAAWWVAMMIGLGPYTGGLLVAVAVYGLVLGTTAALSTRCHPIVAIGGAFFLTSDTLLALLLFLPESLPTWVGPAVMLTYTIGQGLIVAGAVTTLRRRSS